LEQALYARQPKRDSSVRGAQYVSIRYTASTWLRPASSRRWAVRATQLDNALAETNGLCKAELIHRCAPWKTKETVELATLEWVCWFNNYRLLEPIGYLPPAESEANYYRQFANQVSTPA
jgi:transposase InsO family protein